MYPIKRNRRLRSSEALRSLVREQIITPNDFIVPLFIVEGKDIKEEIPSMPDYYRMSLDRTKKEVLALWNMGIKCNTHAFRACSNSAFPCSKFACLKEFHVLIHSTYI